MSARGLLLVALLAAACTDPRGRPAPPSVQLLVSPALVVRSPGTILATVAIHDATGFDSMRATLASSVPALQGDQLFLFPDTTEVTQDVRWDVPAGVPSGTRITLLAKAWNLIGFVGIDSLVLFSQ
jgi:hypothetical protein